MAESAAFASCRTCSRIVSVSIAVSFRRGRVFLRPPETPVGRGRPAQRSPEATRPQHQQARARGSRCSDPASPRGGGPRSAGALLVRGRVVGLQERGGGANTLAVG